MAMKVKDIREWLNGLDDYEWIGIDETGLTLSDREPHDKPKAYLEIGGIPEHEEEEEEGKEKTK